MKQIAIFAALVALTVPALARDPFEPMARSSQIEGPRGQQGYDFRSGANVRTGTGCTLTVEGDEVHSGLCNVGRRGRVTVINTGNRIYRIERSEYDDLRGVLTTETGRVLSTVQARGSCWRGPDASYCAR